MYDGPISAWGRRLAPLVGVLLLAGCGTASAPPIDEELRPALEAVTAAAIERHVRHLASDRLAGRGTGSEGYDLAAQYVAERFAELGLVGAGDAAGYFQNVPLMRADLDVETTVLELRREGRRRRLEHGRDVVVRPDVVRERAHVAAPLVFAGYGVSAPDDAYDDYAGVDVRDSVVVAFRGAPPALPADRRAYHASSWVKLRAAIERGAVGFLSLPDPDVPEAADWNREVARARAGVMRWLEEGGLPRDAFAGLFVQGRLGPSGAAAVFEGAPVSLEETTAAAQASRPQAFALVGTLDVSTAARHVPVRSANVLARLPGSDPELDAELVLLTAHLDHLGIGAEADGDVIYNGAHDNASGVAVLLEVARGLAALPKSPGRSVLFAAVTGEERGLLGSDYLVEHADSLVGTVVANLNLDMVMMLDPLESVVGFGLEHSSLEEPVRLAAAGLGLTIAADPFPRQAVFTRSDQYSFVRRGIPAAMLAPAPGPRFDSFLRSTYHTPRDDLSQAMDFEIGATFARLHILAVHRIAAAPGRPAWNPGDFYGTTFGGLHDSADPPSVPSP